MNSFQEQSWQESFNTREIEILQLIARGKTNLDIAQNLHLSIETVKWYNKQMFMKLDVKNRIQLINKAASLDLLKLEYKPPLSSKPALAGNLPAQLTTFVGRETEIREISALLKNNRLVMLTGAGGSGKTRLALKVGEMAGSSYIDGVWLVKLDDLQDSSFIPQAIAKVLSITEGSHSTLEDALKRYFRNNEILLILDNLEHLPESALLIGELLASSPRLSILGTSRMRLHIYGEQEYPLQPLALPDRGVHKTTQQISTIESIDLFIRRAQAVEPTISLLSNRKLDDLVRVCVLLDGLPLAIELCAPMVKTFSMAQIADRVEKSLDAIPAGPQDLHKRQRTLRATFQWSYQLLEGQEKRLFERIAVFPGGVPLQVIEQVCGEGKSEDIGDLLSSLVNKNLVVAEEKMDGEIYFRMLQTIRQFGLEILNQSGDFEQLANRHAACFMRLAEQASVELAGPNQLEWIDRMILLRENFRTALKWLIEKEETEPLLRFVDHLYVFWLRHADFRESQYWLEQIAALPDAQNFPRAYTDLLCMLSWILWFRGRTERGITLAEEACSRTRSKPDNKTKVISLLNLGLMYLHEEGGLIRGQSLLAEASEISHEIGTRWEHARSLLALALAQIRKEDYSRAFSLYSDSYKYFQELEDITFQCMVRRLIGDLELMRNNLNEGVTAYRESMRISQEVKNPLQTAYNFVGLANAAVMAGNHAQALIFRLASKRILEQIGMWSDKSDLEWEEELETARASLGQSEVQAVLDAGHKLTIDELVEQVYSVPIGE